MTKSARTISQIQSIQRQAGISLYTMLAAIVVLGILSAILVSSFSGTNSKGQMAYSLMVSVSQALQRFNLDTGCYPGDLRGLISLSDANASNYCDGMNLTNQWGGPYLKNQPVNSTGNILVPKIGPNVYLQIKQVTPGNHNVPSTAKSAWGVQLVMLQPAIAKKAAHDCGGAGSKSACSITTNSGTDTLTYVFAVNY